MLLAIASWLCCEIRVEATVAVVVMRVVAVLVVAVLVVVDVQLEWEQRRAAGTRRGLSLTNHHHPLPKKAYPRL